jgi:hypothetical protein
MADLGKLHCGNKSTGKSPVWAVNASWVKFREGPECPQLGHSPDFGERLVLKKADIEVKNFEATVSNDC